MDKIKVDQLAQDRFGKGVKTLNKMEASGLIEELLEQTGQSKPRSTKFPDTDTLGKFCRIAEIFAGGKFRGPCPQNSTT